MGACDPGLELVRTLEVTADNTAEALGVGDVPVLATPALLVLAEGACVGAIANDLPAHETSVGTWAQIEHVKAVPVGASITARATLVGHHGRRLEFLVRIEREGQLVATIRHRRIRVERDRFLAKIAPVGSPPSE